MSRKYHVTIEVEMGDESTTAQAETWAVAMLECAFRKKNPEPCPPVGFARIGWTPEIAMPPSEHPYRPRVVQASEVAQPSPRKK